MKRWLRLRQRSEQPLVSVLKGFVTWIDVKGPEELRGLGPEGLVKLQDSATTNGERFMISEALIGYLLSERRWRSQYREKIKSTVRSFFKSSKAPMPENEDELLACFNEEAPPEHAEDLTLEILKRVIDSSNLMYKAIFKGMFSTGMGIGEVVHWSTQGVEALREALENDEYRRHGLIKIDLPARKKTGRRKRNQPYHVLLGGDALETLKLYLQQRESQEKVFKLKYPDRDFTESVFVTAMYTPLKTNTIHNYWIKRLFRLGLIVPEKGWPGVRYGYNIHQIRDLFRNQAPLARSVGFDPDVAEFFMGHTSKLDSNKYLDFHKRRPDHVVREYKKLLPFVDVESDLAWGRTSSETYLKQQSEIEQLKEQVKMMGKAIRDIWTVDKRLQLLKYQLDQETDPAIRRGQNKAIEELEKELKRGPVDMHEDRTS